MARLVVLRFESNEEAESFVKQEFFDVEQNEHRREAVAMMAEPTQFCDNSDGHRGAKTTAGWTRGKKYGWWVCGKCKKPTRSWTNYRSIISAAVNLLNPRDDAKWEWKNGGQQYVP